MTKSADDNDNAVDVGKKEEEMHCIKCGTFLGAYGPGSNGTIPCSKCKEPNLIDFTGEEFVVKRRKRALKT